jgi:hypothetical protein
MTKVRREANWPRRDEPFHRDGGVDKIGFTKLGSDILVPGLPLLLSYFYLKNSLGTEYLSSKSLAMRLKSL